MSYTLRRYSNRRLYDPQQARNINLDEVTELVRSGRQVRVIDNASGRDITISVLSRALVGSVRSWPDRKASAEVLRMLIAEGGQTGMHILKKTVLASLGAFEVTRQKAEEIIDQLIQKGEVAQSNRSEAVKELLNKADESAKGVRDKVTLEVGRVIESMKVARKKDLQAIEEKVDELGQAIQKLEDKLTEK
jgi:polyhydroxyalkanoate synthesis regulator phasin